MKRIRRVSIEVIRRELNLSVTRPMVAPVDARPDDAVRNERDTQPDLSPPPVCPVCASPRFILSLSEGEDSTIVQRALGKHGIHTQLSTGGELLVCHRSFELQIGTSNVTNVVTQKPQLSGSDPASHGRGDSNV